MKCTRVLNQVNHGSADSSRPYLATTKESQASRVIVHQQSLKQIHGKKECVWIEQVAGEWSFRERGQRWELHQPGWFSFRNARRLGHEIGRQIRGCVSRVVPVVNRFARRLTGWTPESLQRLATVVRDAAENTKLGLDALDYAMLQADRSWKKFRNFVNSDRHAKLLALAWHLCQSFPGWRPFGSVRLAKWLGVCRNTLDSDVKTLRKAKLLLVRPDAKGKAAWSYKRGDSREVIYSGLVIELDASPAELEATPETIDGHCPSVGTTAVCDTSETAAVRVATGVGNSRTIKTVADPGVFRQPEPASGRGGIRTHGYLAASPAFKAGAPNATSDASGSPTP